MNDEITPEEHDAMDARADKASKGPWVACSANEGKCACGLIWSEGSYIVAARYHEEQDWMVPEDVEHANTDFISHVRMDYPRVSAALRRANTENAALRAELASLRASVVTAERMTGSHR